MKILNLIPSSGASLTVDSTLITVDSTTITVDNASNVVTEFSFVISARDTVTECDMIFFNELTETTQTISGACSDYRGFLSIDFTLENVEENNSYQVTINDLSGNLLWRGKAFATSQSDLENFSMTKPGPNNIITI